jgi:hypothetical protein
MQMKPRFILSLAVLVISGLWLAPCARSESYARVCVTTLDADSKEAVLVEESSSRPGKNLVVHLDASTECAALIVPLVEKHSSLANAWRPQLVWLPQWTEKTVPGSGAVWQWNKAGDPFELWIFFFKQDAAGLKEIQKLVAAMQSSKVNSQVLAQQTRKLCEMLSSRMSGDAQIVQGPKAEAVLIGGTKRRVDFPWRDYAQRVPLNDALEGDLVVRHGP